MSEHSRVGVICIINGPIVTIDLPGVRNGEQVKIGELGLFGEVISLSGKQAIVQTYESTDGVRPGEPAIGLGWPLSVELGPGLLGGIFDGVQRPLEKIALKSGRLHPPRPDIPALDRSRIWDFAPNSELEPGTKIGAGTVLGTVQETQTIQHRISVPPGMSGELEEIAPAGDYDLEATIARIRDQRGAAKGSDFTTAGPFGNQGPIPSATTESRPRSPDSGS